MLPTTWWVVCCGDGTVKGILFLNPVSQTVKNSLRNAVRLMHENNYVHGNLQQHNILVVNDKVHILDFDWADTDGTAAYPPELNMDRLMCNGDPNVKPGEKILKST